MLEHPKYVMSTVKCACGNEFQTRSVVEKIETEICSQCHPYYTGKQKVMDTTGRIERFQRSMAKTNSILKITI